MRWKTHIAVILFASLLFTGGFPAPCGGVDYAVKKGLALYRVDLENLAQQILRLEPTDKDQREFLDRLFQMKFAEAERMFEVCKDVQDQEVKRLIADLYVLKAIEAEKMGNWIQSYFAVKDAAEWNPEALKQSLDLGGKVHNTAALAQALEQKVQNWGNRVRFVIRPFPPDQMFRPEKVVLARSEEEEEIEVRHPPPPRRSHGRLDAIPPGGRRDAVEERQEKIRISQKDEVFLFDRFNKALYAYYYSPIERNAQFEIFLPRGNYHVYEKDFTVHPVEFEVSDRSTQVILEPARWFRLTVSEEVHPSDVQLSFHGVEWKDFNHVPFGRYRVRVKNREYTGPAARITFVPKDGASSEEQAAAVKGETVAVEDRGGYRLTLRERTGNERLRYSLLGF